MNPINEEARLRRADIEADSLDYKAAVADLSYLIAVAPGPQPMLARGRVLYKSHEFEKGLSDFVAATGYFR